MRNSYLQLAAVLLLCLTANMAAAGNNRFRSSGGSGKSGNQLSSGNSGNGGGNHSQARRSQFSQNNSKKLTGTTLSGHNHSSHSQTFGHLGGTVNKYQIQHRNSGISTPFGNSNFGKTSDRKVLHQNLGNSGSNIQRHGPGLAGKIKFKPIDPGIGNGKPGHHGHDDHHDHHHGEHQGHHHNHHHQSWPWPWVVTRPFPYPVYRYPNYPIRVTTPVLVSERVMLPNGAINQGGPQLVDGIDLQLVDVRLVDRGDAARNLGPRFRVVVGNRGTRAAGNFQVLAVAAKDQEMSPDSPSMMAEVESVASGQIAKVDIRLPMEAMAVADGQPFQFLAVVVDVSKLIDETSEEDNAGLMEREKILFINAK